MKHGVPHIYNIEHLAVSIQEGNMPKSLPPKAKSWLYARPLGWAGYCWMKRLKIAWRVFKGELDALKWEG